MPDKVEFNQLLVADFVPCKTNQIVTVFSLEPDFAQRGLKPGLRGIAEVVF